MDWFQIEKGVCQGFDFNAEYIMRNAGFNEAEVNVFLEFSCIFYDPVDVGSLTSGSFASLNIWKFSGPILLKPSLKDFEHYFASM